MTQGPYRLKILAGDEEWKAGESMYQRGGVRVLETGAHVLRYVVAGTPRQEVIFTQDAPARCNCEVYQRSRGMPPCGGCHAAGTGNRRAGGTAPAQGRRGCSKADERHGTHAA